MEHKDTLEHLSIEEKTVITLGKFDGVHRGHRKLINTVKKIRQEHGWKSVVFTFNISPQIVLGQKPKEVLMTNRERFVFLERQGFDYLVECPFTEEIRTMTPELFISEVLVKKLNAGAIVVGDDFHFGKDRAGNAETLIVAGKAYGFEVHVIKKEADSVGGRDISSSFIREELALGHMEKVKELLGFSYYITGTIAKGKQLGSKIGIPTINVYPPEEKLLPPDGVYISKVMIDGIMYRGVTNIGTNPTVQGDRLSVETHLLDCKLDLYGKEAHIYLLKFQRPELTFSGIEELQKQMEKDIAAAKAAGH